MQEMLQNLMTQASGMVGSYVPSLLGALAILIVGWVVALIASVIVRGALRRTTIDNRIAEWLAGTDTKIDIESIVGRLVFYVIMLFVLVAFFQALELDLITEPLNALLTQVTEFAPRLIGGGVLLALAWLVATLLRKTVNVALTTAGLDSRVTGDDDSELPISRSISEAVYWLVFLLFLPAILGALSIQGLLSPVQNLIDQVLGFLPNLFAAALILGIGWFIARLVQRIIVNLLSAAGIDSLGDRIGLGTALGDRQLSGLIGLVAYVFILIPVMVSSLNALELAAITEPASAMLGQILDAVPRLFAAGLLLTLAYVVGTVVSDLVRNLLAASGFDRIPGLLGLSRRDDARTPSDLAGSLLMVAVMLFAAVEAAGLLGFAALSLLLSGFIVFAGQIFVGLAVFALGLYLSRVAHQAIVEAGSRNAGVLALAARVSILVLSAAMGLRQMGLANEIITLAFGLLMGALAIGAALAFGLGSREVAGEQVRRWVDSLERRS
jgi:hypothetical protein